MYAIRSYYGDLGVHDDFSIVISGDTLSKKKPDPAPLLHGAEFFGCRPEECMMIGDSVSDVRAARAAGFHVITSYSIHYTKLYEHAFNPA